MLLSVSIIIRNDVTRLSRAINSIQDIADEILIILTENIEIKDLIPAVNIEVYNVKWQSSYQEVRNLVMQKARGNWLLFLEVTEELSSDYNQLRTILKQTDKSGFYLPVIRQEECENYHIEKEIELPHLSLRLIKRKEDFHYKGELYEDITPTITEDSKESCLKVLQLPIISSSILNIIPRELDPFALYNFNINDNKDTESISFSFLKKGINLFWKGKIDTAINELEKGYQFIEGREKVPFLINMILLLLKQKQFKKAKDKIKEGLLDFPEYNIFHFWQGYLYFIIGEKQAAINYLNNILACRENNPKIKGNTYLLLGLIYKEMADYELSEFFLNKAHKLIPINRLVVLGLMKTSKLRGEDFEKFLADFKRKGSTFLYILLEIYYEQRDYSTALKTLKAFPEENKEGDLFLFWKGKILLQQGNYKESLQNLKKISPAFQYYAEVLNLLWLINVYHTPHKESRSVINQIKLLGDSISWNIINFFNKIYFHGKGVIFKFNNMVTRYKFYKKTLSYLDLLIEFSGNTIVSKPIEIMKDLLDNIKIKGSIGEIGLLYYKHRRWEEAYSLLKKDLEQGRVLPELLFLAEICTKLGKDNEGKKYYQFAAEIDDYLVKVFLENKNE